MTTKSKETKTTNRWANDAPIPEWIKKISGMAGHAQERLTQETESFNQYAEKNGLGEALAWRGEDVAKAEGALRFYKQILGIIDHGFKGDFSEADIAREVLAQIERQKTDALREARNGFHSSGYFHNAVGACRLSGFAGQLEDSFGDGAPAIQRLISKAGVIGG
jgi:hypothetical protein